MLTETDDKKAQLAEFEKNYEEIERCVERYRHRWTFKASVMKDFDDIKYEIIAHVWKKWHLYNPKRSIGAWVNTVANNQFRNALRNLYGPIAAPCLKSKKTNYPNYIECLTELELHLTKCKECRAWFDRKKAKDNIRMPVAVEHNLGEVSSIPCPVAHPEETVAEMHVLIKRKLSQLERKVYKLLYEDGATEKLVADFFHFKKDGVRGYKRINEIRAKALAAAKAVMRTL